MRIIAAALSWFAVLGLSAGRAGEPGLIAWWKRNAGIYEEDSSGGGHDGILVDSPSWTCGTTRQRRRRNKSEWQRSVR